MISSFTGDHRWLSNFWPVDINYDGMIFPSVENAYQAAKTTDIFKRYQFIDIGASQAKRIGKTIRPIRDDWDEIKVHVMRSLLVKKFLKGSELGNKLVRTGDCEIIEGNWWGDTFWGVCNGKGENMLGKLIMEVRSNLNPNL